jgi:hypothetical protein
MTKPKAQPNEFIAFTDALVEELMAMPDEQVLEGSDPAKVQEFGNRLLEAAKAEAGRRRLARAQAARANRLAKSGADVPDVSPADARAYLAKAANDPRFTLAARKLDEMSDDDVLVLYRQAKQLESENKG